MLRVYELKGSGRPPEAPAEGLQGIWPEPPFYYLFYRKEPAELIPTWLKTHPGWRLTGRYHLPYEKWQDISAPQISLGPFDILITANSQDKPGRIKILMDPGVVFGSGFHPTTQGCLLAISEVFASNEIHTAVDFGAGTGILAIACALAGAKFTLAIDRNPLALQSARKNGRSNGAEDRIAFVEAEGLGCFDMSPDLLVMNLEWPVIEKILAAGQWKSARRVILAGFLQNRLESAERFARPEFQVDKVTERQGWPTLTLTRA